MTSLAKKVHVISLSALFRAAVRRSLSDVSGYVMSGQAATLDIAHKQLATNDIDICLIDFASLTKDDFGSVVSLLKLYPDILFVGITSKIESEPWMAGQLLGMGLHAVIHLADGEETDMERLRSELFNHLNRLVREVDKSSAIGSGEKTVEDRVGQRWSWLRKDVYNFGPRLIVIGASTGGPPVIERMLRELEVPPLVPVLVIQHMPVDYTGSFAENLAKVSKVNVMEAKDGQEIEPGRVLLAPGGSHLELAEKDGKICIALHAGPLRNFVRPSLDVTLQSVVRTSLASHCMSFIMTGLGRDGASGAVALKEADSAVMIQDKESSVVWGMPGSVYEIKAYDAIGSIDECCRVFAKMCRSSPGRYRAGKQRKKTG